MILPYHSQMLSDFGTVVKTTWIPDFVVGIVIGKEIAHPTWKVSIPLKRERLERLRGSLKIFFFFLILGSLAM